jgi:formamidopyrimidine-DNA glycosylase
MPEMPEVEIVRRGLEPVLRGQTFARVEARRPDLRFRLPPRFARRLEGQRILSLGRRAKYLLARLEGGDVLVMHLGMTGRFSVRQRGEKGTYLVGEFETDTGVDPKHDHVIFHVSNGATITYNDPRRFGFMLLVAETRFADHRLFKDLGAEPLGNEMSAVYLARRAAGRRRDLKAFLMDQRVVAGLGNIYVCEALFRAGLSPLRSASTLTRKNGGPTARAERLVPVIRAVLEQAIAAGGSTLRDYRQADGTKGAFQHSFSVYGRVGEPCLRPGCRGIVRRAVQGGRSTFFCPACQR